MKGSRGFNLQPQRFRPHTMIPGSRGMYGPLAPMLSFPRPSGLGALPLHYCGTTKVDGHPCHVFRGDFDGRTDEGKFPSHVLKLATDRNDIPIRSEYYLGNRLRRPILGALSRCDDLREIAPGVWYPFRITEMSLDTTAMLSQGWVVLHSRRETTIESASLPARVDEAIFRDVPVRAGTNVEVLDEHGRLVGNTVQAEDGVPAFDQKSYLKLLLARDKPRTNLGVQRADDRKRAELVGEPVPDFLDGMTWVGGEPPTWPDLRGKLVILVFWAEWDNEGRDDLAQLGRLLREHPKDGPIVIGIHPPGGEPAEIRRAAEDQHLAFPTGVNTPAPEGAGAAGVLFDSLVVPSVPYAVVVNGEGKIVDLGPIGDVLVRCKRLIEKGR